MRSLTAIVAVLLLSAAPCAMLLDYHDGTKWIEHSLKTGLLGAETVYIPPCGNPRIVALIKTGLRRTGPELKTVADQDQADLLVIVTSSMTAEIFRMTDGRPQPVGSWLGDKLEILGSDKHWRSCGLEIGAQWSKINGKSRRKDAVTL